MATLLKSTFLGWTTRTSAVVPESFDYPPLNVTAVAFRSPSCPAR